MEELTENAEEPDDGDSKKEEQKLGKLQYKVGYVACCPLREEAGTSYAPVYYLFINIRKFICPLRHSCFNFYKVMTFIAVNICHIFFLNQTIYLIFLLPIRFINHLVFNNFLMHIFEHIYIVSIYSWNTTLIATVFL